LSFRYIKLTEKHEELKGSSGAYSTCSIVLTDMTVFLMNKPDSELILSYSEGERMRIHNA